MFSADSLPDNPALLKALVSAQQAEIEHLKFVIAKLRRMQFGRRSEQMGETITQLELALEELECGRGELLAMNRPSQRTPIPARTNRCRKRRLQPRPSPNANRCLSICHGTPLSTSLQNAPARTVAVLLKPLGEDVPKCLSTCRPVPRDPPCSPETRVCGL
jgi:hypothetical protein